MRKKLESLNGLEEQCKEKFDEIQNNLLDGVEKESTCEDVDVVSKVKEAFKAVGGKVKVVQESPTYVKYSGLVGNYTIEGSISGKGYIKGDLNRLAEDLTMAYNVKLGGKREYIPNFIKRITYEESMMKVKRGRRLKEAIDNSSVIMDLQSIESFLDSNGFYNYDVYDYEVYPLDTSMIRFEVRGDWKHDHLYFKSLINEWSEDNDRPILKIDSEEVGESDSDYYTAIYSVFIPKDEESFDTLQSMRGLFV